MSGCWLRGQCVGWLVVPGGQHAHPLCRRLTLSAVSVSFYCDPVQRMTKHEYRTAVQCNASTVRIFLACPCAPFSSVHTPSPLPPMRSSVASFSSASSPGQLLTQQPQVPAGLSSTHL